MNRKLVIILFLIVLVLGVIYVQLTGGIQLQSQLLNDGSGSAERARLTPVERCYLQSEQLANKCFHSLALNEKDSSLCDLITRQDLQEECVRDVEIR